MAKRFTDTTKWQRPTFRRLPPEMKLFWIFLVDNCDHAGIWIKDIEAASFLIGRDYKEDEVLEWFNKDEKRIEVLSGGSRWFIREFVNFHYGDVMNPKNNAHLGAMKILDKYNIRYDKIGEVDTSSVISGSEDTKEKLLKDQKWHQAISKNTSTDIGVMYNYLKLFLRDQEECDGLYRPVNEIKSHFKNWLLKKKKDDARI